MKGIVKSLPLLIKISISLCVVLIIAATLHQFQLGSESYVRSWLIPIEIISVLLVLVTSILQILVIPYYLYLKRWRFCCYFLASAIINLLSIFAAFSIDAETILYAT